MEPTQKKRRKSFMGNKDGHFVYILECVDGSLYTGYTTNIVRRVQKHSTGKGAKYTRGRGPFQLRLSESYPTKEEAMKREYAIMQMTSKEKITVIETKLYQDEQR